MQVGPILAVALLGGFAAGTVGGMLFSPPAGESADEPLLASVSGDSGSGELVDKYRALEARNASLEAAVDALELQVQSLANRREAVAAPVESVESENEAKYASAEAAPYTLEEEMRFRAYVDNLEKQKEEERELEREERRQEQLARRVDRMAEELGLDDYQKGEMNKVLAESEQATRDYFAQMRESGEWDRDAMRTGMADLNDKTDQALGAFLTPDQLDKYQESNSGFSRFFVGGRDGGGGRGGPPGGGRDGGGGRGGFNQQQGGGGGRGGF
ncbi:MAG: hypothetical protein MK209_04605 [Planctomycetes bacterium]|nr:hypothetical protein [Planctomycetota bacterium]